MILKKINIVNFKNLTEVSLEPSPKINCFIGNNGVGKTNFLDALYYLSFCKSFNTSVDSQVIKHDADFFMLEGIYDNEQGGEDVLFAGMKRNVKKQFKRNGKLYSRLSEHIGRFPLVIVAPSDTNLIGGGSEERRRLLDMLISQYNPRYTDALLNYNKALQQRNVLLKQEGGCDDTLLLIWEEQMALHGTYIYEQREKLMKEFLPIFQEIYKRITKDNEKVSLKYCSHGQRGDLLSVIQNGREKDKILGYSLHGVHKDDLEMELNDFPMKREGSQGQCKSFALALKLAQFDVLRVQEQASMPLLLLDDIFDKLDSVRVEEIVKLVAGNRFGQIFITDTNREHLDKILHHSSMEYALFDVEKGNVKKRRTDDSCVG